jgi:signal transduction histidine kinase
LFPFPRGADEQATINFCQRASGEFLATPDGYAVYMREMSFLRSVGTIDGLVVFDIVPYLVVQNAVKYSPPASDVIIKAEETETEIIFRVMNWGPQLDDDEIQAIFEQGVRGRRSREAGIAGSGFGLYFLRELVEVHHGGRVNFWQEGKSTWAEGTLYSFTTMEIALPRADV